MDKPTEDFIKRNPVKGMLHEQADRLRHKAMQLDALAQALPDYLGSEAAETAMRALVIAGSLRE